MTTVLAENANRDLYLNDSGHIAILTGADAVGQLCKSRVEAQRNEMIYAMNEGMPTAATAWNTFNPKQFEAAARAIWLATDGVTGVQSFTMYKDSNTLNYTAVITTKYGSTTITSGVLTQ